MQVKLYRKNDTIVTCTDIEKVWLSLDDGDEFTLQQDSEGHLFIHTPEAKLKVLSVSPMGLMLREGGY